MQKKYIGPYISLRHFLDALEYLEHVLHIDEINQDEYEATALMYRMIEKYSAQEAPVLFFDQILSKNRIFKKSSIGNLFGKWDLEAMALGIVPTNSSRENYKLAIKKIEQHIDENGKWPRIKPIVIEARKAPCKENILQGENIDLFNFPFLQTNPADNGCYINTGSVILEDTSLGRNIGTYRCQIKNSNTIGINPQINQDGWKFLNDLRAQGEKNADVAIALGTDPITFSMSGSKVAKYGEDELEIAGGLIGEAIETVKCETNNIHVPANSELILEGQIPLNKMESEGPFGEMYGYIGEEKKENFFMKVKAITHRNNPIIPNQFTGITRGCLTAPIEASLNRKYRSHFKEFVGLYYPLEYPGFCFVNLGKTTTEKTFEIGRYISTTLKIAKITILFDKDVDIHNLNEVLHALGSRWQPQRSSEIIEKASSLSGDPSSNKKGEGNRIIIDATRNATESQNNQSFAKMNIECLRSEFPNLLERIDEKFKEII
ncbi:MAG: hypothetical protein CL517_02010 [Actinobacteria bacterium]|nr:hypothetical protein [Actinomycetota bacterium]